MSRVFTLALMLTLPFTATVQADEQIATFNHTGVLTWPHSDVSPEWYPFVGYSAPGYPPVGVLGNVTMDLADIFNGSELELTGDFATIETFAINGLNNDLWLGFEAPPGSTGSFVATNEFALLNAGGFLAPGLGNPDFASRDLTRVTVVGAAWSQISEVSSEITLMYTVYAEPVPEPAWYMVAFTAITATWACRRRCSYAAR